MLLLFSPACCILLTLSAPSLSLFSVSDGFHPSTTGNALLAAAYWDWLNVNVPAAINDVNPNNADIQRIFGDQGGYGY